MARQGEAGHHQDKKNEREGGGVLANAVLFFR